MTRLKLLLAYDGTSYSGWQIQCKPSPPPTIQGEVEKALTQLCGVPARICGASRTDAGVHACGQSAHCDVPDGKKLDWRKSLNALLPQNIRILQAEPCSSSFHACKDVLRKTYAYRFWQERHFVPPHLVHFVWACGQLDIRAMREALEHFVGQHDFCSLQNSGADTHTSVRCIQAATLEEQPPCQFYPAHQPELRLLISAGGFLKQMVRNIAGVLVEIGRGKLKPSAVPEILASRSRQANPCLTAPAAGLTLLRVTYAKK